MILVNQDELGQLTNFSKKYFFHPLFLVEDDR